MFTGKDSCFCGIAAQFSSRELSFESIFLTLGRRIITSRRKKTVTLQKAKGTKKKTEKDNPSKTKTENIFRFFKIKPLRLCYLLRPHTSNTETFSPNSLPIITSITDAFSIFTVCVDITFGAFVLCVKREKKITFEIANFVL